MIIERNDKELIIRVPGDLDADNIQRMIDYLLYKNATKDSKATQDEVDKLAKEVNKKWWKENKKKIILF